MPPPGKPRPPRERLLPPLPGPPIRLPEAMVASLAQGDFVIIRSTSSEFQSLEGLVSQKSLELNAHAGKAADATGRAAANRIKLRLVSMNVGRTPGAGGLRQMARLGLCRWWLCRTSQDRRRRLAGSHRAFCPRPCTFRRTPDFLGAELLPNGGIIIKRKHMEACCFLLIAFLWEVLFLTC